MVAGKRYLLAIFIAVVLVLLPVSAGAGTLNQGETVKIGDSGLDLSQAVGTSTAIAWWEPGSDITNSSPSKVLLIGNNVTNFSIRAEDFVEHPGNWYRYDASTPDRAGPVAFVVYGYCGTAICPKPTIHSSAVGKEEAQERLKNRPPEDETIWISDNIAEFLQRWNEKLEWGFTSQQINDKVLTMNESVLSKYRKPESPGYFTVPNRTVFYLEVGEALGLTRTQSEVFAQSVNADFAQSRMRNFESGGRSYDIPGPNATTAAGTGSHTPAPIIQERTEGTKSLATSDGPLGVIALLRDGIVNATGKIFRVS